MEELASAVGHGTSLDELMRALADDLSDGRLARVARKMADAMKQGADLPAAMEAVADALPRHLREAVAVGAETGNLPSILVGLSEAELAHRRMRGALWRVASYPLLIVTVQMLVLLFLSAYVVPTWRDLFNDWEIELPPMTELVLQFSDLLPVLMLVFVVLVGALLVAPPALFGSRLVHWFRTSLPLFGRAWVWMGQHEFATLMATLVRNGGAGRRGAALHGGVAEGPERGRAARIAREKCEAGKTLGESLAESIHFDPTLTALVARGEAGQTLPDDLAAAAGVFEKQMDVYTRFLYRVLPPLLLTFVARRRWCSLRA